MSNNTLKAKIQIRRNHTKEWELYKNVVPAAGEPCFDLDTGVLKIGDGIKTYEQLDAISGGVSVSADGNSIVLTDEVFKLAGFDGAAIGAQPRKGDGGILEWIVPSSEVLDNIQATVSALQDDINAIYEILTPSGEGEEPLLARVEALETKIDNTTAIESIRLGGTLLEVIEKSVNIPIADANNLGVVRGSNEITVAADGTLGIGTVGISKLMQEDGVDLVLDGGAAN